MNKIIDFKVSKSVLIRTVLSLVIISIVFGFSNSRASALTPEERAHARMVWLDNSDVSSQDQIEFYELRKEISTIRFDSALGPEWTINYSSKSILNCSSSGAKIISLSVRDNELSMTLYSDEHPVNETYVFDLSKNIYQDGEDEVESGRYTVYHNGVLSFDTNFGPSYDIDYNTGKLISCSSSGARIISFNKSGDIVTLEVYSDEFPANRTYTIDLSKNLDSGSVLIPGKTTDLEASGGDKLDYYYLSGDVLSFDSVFGPSYMIDIKNSKILDCSSDFCFPNQDKAKIISLKNEERYITLTVWSAELPQEVTYIFDKDAFTQNNNDDPAGNTPVFDEDVVEYYNVYEKDQVIEFDSEHGPWYSIDYKNKKILGCSSSGAMVRDLTKNGNTLSVTLYSDEYPKDTTYEFDLGQNNHGNYDDSTGVSFANFDGSSFDEKNGKDKIDYFNVFRDKNLLEFDSEYGPYYKIDLKNKKILDCTSDSIFPNDPPAALLACNDYGNRITVKVFSKELPYRMTYTFDLENNVQVAGVSEFNDDKLNTEVQKIVRKVSNGTYQGNGLTADTIENIKNALSKGHSICPVVYYKSDSESDLKQKTINLIENCAENNELETVQYISISIKLYANGYSLGYITELTDNVDFSLFVNDEESRASNDYSVIQIHNGKAKVLDASGSKKIVFKTREFSDYALVKKAPKRYKVTFNMMGHGSKIKAQEVRKKGHVTKPAQPQAKGYAFVGWYSDKKYKSAYNFNSKVTKNFTLYAKWKKVTDKTAFTTGKGNRKLKFIVLSQSKKTAGFTGAPGATSIVIPDTVKYCGYTYKVVSIEKQALYKHSTVKSITVGKNVSSIKEKAFTGCSKLTSLTIKSGKLTKVEKRALSSLPAKLKIKVPKKYLSKYKKLFKKGGLSDKISVKYN